MKATKTFYWISTLLLSLLMLYNAYAYLTMPMMKQAFQHLGFPAYFRIELAVAKFIGVVALLLPAQARWKEWVYAGFAITFISAFIAHSSSGDPVSFRIMPLIALVLLIVSYITYHRKSKTAVQSSSLKTAVL